MTKHTLNRILGRGFSVAACVGLVIGLGILRTPGEIAATINEPLPYMALWIGGGLFVLLSLLVVAELISMTPRSGGIYGMIHRAYGAFPGFVIGWIDWVSTCATLSLKAVVLVEYMSLLLPSLAAHQTITVLLITSFFALLQLGGTRLGAGIQETASTGIGLIVIGLTCALFYGVISNGGQVAVDLPVDAVFSSPGIAGFGLVVAAIIFTYDGWYAASYFGGEVKSGGRAVALGSLQGVLIIISLYVLLNLALVLSVPLPALAGHDLALAGALDLVFANGAGTAIIIAAMFILLAHLNLQYMLASRTLFSLSEDGFGSRRATIVTDKGAPAGATVLSWILVTVLVLIGKFEFLLNLVATLFVVMYVALVLGVFRLRRKEPVAERPFRAWGFPYTGIVCAIGWTAIALFVAVTSLHSTLFGALLILIAVPIYYLLKRVRHLAEGASTAEA